MNRATAGTVVFGLAAALGWATRGTAAAAPAARGDRGVVAGGPPRPAPGGTTCARSWAAPA